MNQIPYEERCKVYTNALITYGDQKQMVKCLEELACDFGRSVPDHRYAPAQSEAEDHCEGAGRWLEQSPPGS